MKHLPCARQLLPSRRKMKFPCIHPPTHPLTVHLPFFFRYFFCFCHKILLPAYFSVCIPFCPSDALGKYCPSSLIQPLPSLSTTAPLLFCCGICLHAPVSRPVSALEKAVRTHLSLDPKTSTGPPAHTKWPSMSVEGGICPSPIHPSSVILSILKK